MTTFNLRAVLHDAVQSTDEPDPGAVAESAFTAIDPADYGEALRQAIDLVMPHYIAETRPTRRGTRKSKGARKRPSGSRLVERTRKFLASKEYSPFRGAWILLGDATVEDAESIAEARYTLAEQTRAKGNWWAGVAKEIAEHGVVTFGELPEDVIRELDDELEGDGDDEDKDEAQ